MNINPKLTEKVVEVSAKAKKAVVEKVSKGETFEESIAELPRMSLESVMPKGNIIRTAQKAAEEFDVKKAIEEFSDVHDTETIEKICKEWKKELDAMTKKFTDGEINPIKVYEEHRSSIASLEKYNDFSMKIMDMMTNSGNIEEASKIFEKYIEPSILNSQATMHVIDNLPSVRSAYQMAKGQAPAAKVSIKQNFQEEIKSLTSLNEASALLTKLEKEKAIGTISANEFNKYNEALGQQLEDIVSGKVKPATTEVAEGIKTAAAKASIDTKSLSHEIDTLVAVDLASGRVGDISNKLTELASTDKEAYARLSEKFNEKLIKISS
ncbi:MAG: hypothetical protein K6E29_06885 [Cyanobacteria bacterium RUI128]|nr:hypothetical protein [Cyanobacteria bacterium RUI128]